MAPKYLDHFGVREAPFSIAPDPRYLYLSPKHREALAHLLYGVQESDGFVVLTGEVGAGKTTICRCLLEQLPPQCDVALVFNPKLSVVELLATICEEFHVPLPQDNTSIKVFIDRLNDYLLGAHAAGRVPVLIIDEAQSLAPDVLEQIRLLTNLETNTRKLLRIVLLGQPQLREVLARPDLLQLSQRILARYHLSPLSREETSEYVEYRLQVAGAPRNPFTKAALRLLYAQSGGVPRLINVLADRALLGAYVLGEGEVQGATMAQSGNEVFGSAIPRRWPRFALAGLAAALLLVPAWFHGELTQATKGGLSVARAEISPGSPGAALIQISSLPASPLTPAPSSPSAEVVVAAINAQPAPGIGDGGRSGDSKAFQALFRQWGISLGAGEKGEAACGRAETLGLRCLSEQGNVADLRRINRPAVLSWRSAGGSESLATLVAWQGDRALVAEGDGVQEVPESVLAERWSGQYTLLWRLPSRYWEVIRLGSRGPLVERLALQLAFLRGQPYGGGKLVYDEELQRQVRDFQLTAGLAPDGVAGPQTLIRLDKAVERAAPRLSAREGDE